MHANVQALSVTLRGCHERSMLDIVSIEKEKAAVSHNIFTIMALNLLSSVRRPVQTLQEANVRFDTHWQVKFISGRYR
jgi:hypothetical protein